MKSEEGQAGISASRLYLEVRRSRRVWISEAMAVTRLSGRERDIVRSEGGVLREVAKSEGGVTRVEVRSFIF